MRTARPRTGHLSQLGARRQRAARSHARPAHAGPGAARRLDGGRGLLLARVVAVALALLGAWLPATAAHAAGTVTLADRSPKEDGGRWKLKMTINYGGTPHLGHIPMLFSFTPTVHYERALTDQSPEKPILNKIPLQNQQAINESMDVGFSDGSGKVFSITKFDFVLRRDRGFEAGEYELVIKRASDGVQMGQKQRITLQGENEVIDRRAIVFTGEKKKKDTSAGKADAEKGDEPATEEDAASEPASDAAEADAPSGDALPDEAPPPVDPKQGGCGCRLAPAEAATPLALPLVALGAAAAFARRRRARRG
ncbi:MYXO-CTERM sorting domain-containing protein [Sorangium cellulosum]|uniref:MYXO-CTERM sorting domain-containing protein n=1 Tax=Sorangium TaxID=39643 RepID=UPI000B105856|nr:MYXO-CTERM sorting domain-containing protein [Sorangium cellulosum]